MKRRFSWRSLEHLESRITPFVPNDPFFTQQYHLAITQTPAAWEVTTGQPIIVAIADDGLALNHPDLAASLWVNPGEIAGNGKDDDGNGFIDDVHGYDFFAYDGNPIAENGDTHGTHVGGIVGARTNNGTGVAGYAGGGPNGPGVQLMTLRFTGNGVGTGKSADVAAAFKYAADNGAKIINTSHTFDGFASSSVVKAAVDYAHSKGVLMINSAGNNNANNPNRGAFTQILFTAATDSSDQKTIFSNYGRFIDVAAPGMNVMSTTWDSNHTKYSYRMISGTSMASPNAAGVAALIWSANPTWTRDQVAAQLIGTADPIDHLNPGFEGLLGYGRVNALKAVTGSPPAPFVRVVAGLPADGGHTTSKSFAIELDAPLRFDPATVSVNAFELRSAGADGIFGTADDKLIPLTLNGGSPYHIGTDGFTLTYSGSLAIGTYRFTAKAGVLADPFGKALDGNRDGVPGDDFVRTFRVAVESISGRFYEDLDVSLLMGTPDPRLPGWTAYIDANNNGKLDLGEATAISDDAGLYTFLDLPAGTHIVRRITEPGWLDNRPASGFYSVTLATTSSTSSVNHFGQLRTGSVYGRVFEDLNANGLRETADPNLEGRTVWLDLNGDGMIQANEPQSQSDANGLFVLTGAPSGNYPVRIVAPAGWAPATAAVINTVTGPAIAATGLRFGQWQQNAVYGRFFDDANGDGLFGAGESPLTGWRAYVDRNGNGKFDAPVFTLASTNVPINTINMGTTSSKLTVNGFAHLLTDVTVKLSITTAYAGDIAATLIAPDGRRVKLFTHVGGSDENFTDTVLSDSAATAIGTGSAPFTGTFRPEEPLATFRGMNPNGVWLLELKDIFASYTGKLTAWSLAFETAEPSATSAAHGGFVLPGLASGQHIVRRELLPGWGGTAPADDRHFVSVAAGGVYTGREFGQQQGPPRVLSVVVNDGGPQRSRVDKLTVTFDRAVSFPNGPAAAFAINRIGSGGSVPVAVDLSGSTSTRTVAVLSFEGPLVQFGSLMDGKYQLEIPAAAVTEAGTPMAAAHAAVFYRLFGDADGNGTVDSLDFAAFGSEFGSSKNSSPFDFDLNGSVDSLDFAMFGSRFGTSV